MNYYYLIPDTEHEPDSLVVFSAQNDIQKFPDYFSWRCEKIDYWNSSNIVYIKEGSMFEDYLLVPNDADFSMISKKMKNILEKLEVKGYQVFQLPLKHLQTNTIHDNYYIFNITNLLKTAVDMEKSRKILDTIAFYTLKKEVVKSHDLFRVGDGRIFISDRLKKAWEQAGVTGIEYGRVKLS